MMVCDAVPEPWWWHEYRLFVVVGERARRVTQNRESITEMISELQMRVGCQHNYGG